MSKWNIHGGNTNGQISSWAKPNKHFLRERHTFGISAFKCTCSYCQHKTSLPVFFWIPRSKTWNAWWVFGWESFRYRYYIRFHIVRYSDGKWFRK